MQNALRTRLLEHPQYKNISFIIFYFNLILRVFLFFILGRTGMTKRDLETRSTQNNQKVIIGEQSRANVSCEGYCKEI